MKKLLQVSLDSIIYKSKCKKRIVFNNEYFVVNLLVDLKRSVGKAGAHPEAKEKTGLNRRERIKFPGSSKNRDWDPIVVTRLHEPLLKMK